MSSFLQHLVTSPEPYEADTKYRYEEHNPYSTPICRYTLTYKKRSDLDVLSAILSQLSCKHPIPQVLSFLEVPEVKDP